MSLFSSTHSEERMTEESSAEVNENVDNSKLKETDNVGQTSVEIDVESLISELEAESASGVDKEGHLRRRLDEILDKKQHAHDLDDFEDYEIED